MISSGPGTSSTSVNASFQFLSPRDEGQDAEQFHAREKNESPTELVLAFEAAA